MNPWWLVFIIPMSAAVGAMCMALMIAAGQESRREEEEDGK